MFIFLFRLHDFDVHQQSEAKQKENERWIKAFGIKDVSVKQGGSRNKATRYRAIFLGLRKGVRTKHEVSRILGRKLFNKLNCYYNEHE